MKADRGQNGSYPYGALFHHESQRQDQNRGQKKGERQSTKNEDGGIPAGGHDEKRIASPADENRDMKQPQQTGRQFAQQGKRPVCACDEEQEKNDEGGCGEGRTVCQNDAETGQPADMQRQKTEQQTAHRCNSLFLIEKPVEPVHTLSLTGACKGETGPLPEYTWQKHGGRHRLFRFKTVPWEFSGASPTDLSRVKEIPAGHGDSTKRLSCPLPDGITGIFAMAMSAVPVFLKFYPARPVSGKQRGVRESVNGCFFG